MEAHAQHWYMPGSVLNALWGNIMPRLAASLWLGSLEWPPRGVTPVALDGGVEAYPIEGEALEDFAGALVRIAFGRGSHDRKAIEKSYVGAAENQRRLTDSQRSTLVVTEYFHPGAAAAHLADRPDDRNRMPLRAVKAKGYDFVLSDRGLDFFVPPKPGGTGEAGESEKVAGPQEEEAAREHVLQFYKFRETSKPPIGLPKAPMTAFPQAQQSQQRPTNDSFINIPQLTAPTGAHQVPEGWMKGLADEVGWWVSGALYRGIMAAFPRIVASMWYEEVAWDPSRYHPGGSERTYRSRFHEDDGLKSLLEERVETVLPAQLDIFVEQRPSWLPPDAKGWNERDVMIASDGIYFPDPGPAPPWEELAKAIESGVAGNPVFTDSGPGGK